MWDNKNSQTKEYVKEYDKKFNVKINVDGIVVIKQWSEDFDKEYKPWDGTWHETITGERVRKYLSKHSQSSNHDVKEAPKDKWGNEINFQKSKYSYFSDDQMLFKTSALIRAKHNSLIKGSIIMFVVFLISLYLSSYTKIYLWENLTNNEIEFLRGDNELLYQYPKYIFLTCLAISTASTACFASNKGVKIFNDFKPFTYISLLLLLINPVNILFFIWFIVLSKKSKILIKLWSLESELREKEERSKSN